MSLPANILQGEAVLSWIARIGVLYHVHCEEAECLYSQLIQNVGGARFVEGCHQMCHWVRSASSIEIEDGQPKERSRTDLLKEDSSTTP